VSGELEITSAKLGLREKARRHEIAACRNRWACLPYASVSHGLAGGYILKPPAIYSRARACAQLRPTQLPVSHAMAF
jgi:hypothetical protein